MQLSGAGMQESSIVPIVSAIRIDSFLSAPTSGRSTSMSTARLMVFILLMV